jgi:hypothetical protein
MNALQVAEALDFIREAGQNTGQRVEAVQRWCGGQPGESWCAYFATMCLDIAYKGKAPLPRQGSVQAIRELAQSHGWVTTVPQVGDLFLYVNAQDHAHHIGFVSGVDPLIGIAGNTSEDGTSSNGDGVYTHPINAHLFIRLPA